MRCCADPSAMMSVDDLNLHFPQIDKATLEHSNSNLYAVLITYTKFNPITIGRQRAGLTSIANPTANIPLAQLSGKAVSWEAKITEFEARPGAERISESIKMAALVSMCPAKLKDHLQLNAQHFRSYQELREEVFVYLDHTQATAATAMDVRAQDALCAVGLVWPSTAPRSRKEDRGMARVARTKGNAASQISIGGLGAQRIKQLGAMSVRRNVKRSKGDEDESNQSGGIGLTPYCGMEPFRARSNLVSGAVHPIVMSEEGHLRVVKFQVADVNKVLTTSAAQVANQGYKITMDHRDGESFFQDQELNDRFTLHQEDGIYVHYLNVLPYLPRGDEGFHGQSSRDVRPNYALHAMEGGTQDGPAQEHPPEFNDGSSERSDFHNDEEIPLRQATARVGDDDDECEPSLLGEEPEVDGADESPHQEDEEVKAHTSAHKRHSRDEDEKGQRRPLIALDYFFLGQGGQDKEKSLPILAMVEEQSKKWRVQLPEFGEAVWCQPLKGERASGKLEAKFEDGIFLGVQEGSALKWIGTPTGVQRCWSVKCKPEPDRWDRALMEVLIGLPWKLRPRLEGRDQDAELPRQIEVVLPPQVEEAKAEEPRKRGYKPRGIYIRRDVELEEYGFTPGCDGCEAAQLGLSHKHHSMACRKRIRDEMMKTPEGKKKAEAIKRRAEEYIVKFKEAEDKAKQSKRPAESVEDEGQSKQAKSSGEREFDELEGKLIQEGILPPSQPIGAASQSDPLPAEELSGWGEDCETVPIDADVVQEEMQTTMDVGSLQAWRKGDDFSQDCVREADLIETMDQLQDECEPAITRLQQYPKVQRVKGGMCRRGMTGSDEFGEGAVKKRTGFLTNSKEIAAELGILCENRANELKVWKRIEFGATKAQSPKRGGPEWKQVVTVTMDVNDNQILQELRNFQQASLSELWFNFGCGRDVITMFYDKDLDSKWHRHVPLMVARPRRQRRLNKCPLGSMDLGPVNEEPYFDEEALKGEDWSTFIDEVSGKALETSRVNAARAEELDFARRYDVWTLAPTKECWEFTGKAAIGCRWIDIDKGDADKPKYRSRLVVEVRMSGTEAVFCGYTTIGISQIFAFLAEILDKVMFIDVRRAHCTAKIDRLVYVRLPPEAILEDCVEPMRGRLNKAMYGCRDAARQWEAEITDFFVSNGFVPGLGIPLLFVHTVRDIKVTVHGDDVTSLGRPEDLKWLKERFLERYEIKYGGTLGDGPDDVQDVMILNRLAHYDSFQTTIEADPRHVQILLRELNLENANATVTPGVRCDDADSEPLNAAETSRYRSMG
eukprot:s2252_g6.t1